MWWTIGGWVIAAVGAAVVVWALWWDRARGRVRCRRCWYALDETPADDAGVVTCSECGRAHGSRRAMLRTRRRWWCAAAGAVVVAVGLSLVMTPKVRALGPMGVLPTWVLVELVPLYDAAPMGQGVERVHPARQLTQRLVAAEIEARRAGPLPANVQANYLPDMGPAMGERAQRRVLRRVARGNVLAPIGSERWAETYGRWFGGQRFRFGRGDVRHYAGGAEADQALIVLLDEIERIRAPWTPTTRDVWPRGVPVHIETTRTHASWTSLRSSEHARWTAHGARRTEGEAEFRLSFPIPAIEGERVRLELELSEFFSSPWDRVEDEEPVRTERFELSWRVAETVEEVITPVRSAELDASVSEGLVFGSEYWDIDASGVRGLGEPGLVFGVLFTYYDGETALGTMEGCWRSVAPLPGQFGGSWGNTESLVPEGVRLGDAIAAARAAGRLRVKAEGRPELALQMLDADRYWAGEVWFDLPAE